MVVGRALILILGIGFAVNLPATSTDLDFDGIADSQDNCLELANPQQLDSDRDGLGNGCDFDLNNDCRVDPDDLSFFWRAMHNAGAAASQVSDFNADQRVDFADLVLLARSIGQPVGESGGANVCTCRSPEVRTGSPNDEFGGVDLFLLGLFTQTVPGGGEGRPFSDQGRGRYLSRVYTRYGGRYEYRVADPSLSLEYCGLEEAIPYASQELANAACTGVAGTVDLPTAGCYEFTLQAPVPGEPAEQVELRVAQRLGSRDIQVDPDGGRYSFPSGIVLEIPRGAVTGPVTLNIAELPCAAADALFGSTMLKSHEHRCLGGIVGEPDGFTFDKPVTIKLPVDAFKDGEIPLWVTSAAGAGGYSLIPGEIELDGGKDILKTAFTHFSKVAGTAAENTGPEVSTTGSLPPCCSDSSLSGPDGCCCDTMRLQVAEGDVSGSGCDCQLVGQDIEVEFLACPGKPLQRVSEFHSSENCPTDFSASVEPAELTLWTCEDRSIEFSLAGTNDDGTECRLSMPTRPVVSGDSGIVELVDTGADSYRLTGRKEGSVDIEFASLVLKDTTIGVRADVVSLEARWRAVERGSQTCRVAGDSYGESDSGAGTVRTQVADCERIIFSTPTFSGDTAMAGPLTKTGNPSAPFTFELSPNDPTRTVDCVVFMQSNGRSTSFGEPFCPDTVCQALSCTEAVDVEGKVRSAKSEKISTDSEWDFRASWLEHREDGVFDMSARCTGSSDTAIKRK